MRPYNPICHLLSPMPGNRQSTRMPDFDYTAAAAYFISLCTEERIPLFGRVVDAQVQSSEFGIIVRDEWLRTPFIRPTVHLDEWIVMPDHFHAIVGIGMKPETIGKIGKEIVDRNVGAHSCAPCHEGTVQWHRPSRSLATLVAQFKATTTRRINELRRAPDQRVWQRNYNDRIIRNEVELDKVRDYIRKNPKQHS